MGRHDIDFGPSELAKDVARYVPARKDREYLLDSIHCATHNLWGTLEGNTAESDVVWFARVLFDANNIYDGRRWDNAEQATRDHWTTVAALTLDNLPRIMSRIASRCKAMAEASKIAIEAHRATKGGES